MILPGMFTIIVRLWFNVLFNVLYPKYPINLSSHRDSDATACVCGDVIKVLVHWT